MTGKRLLLGDEAIALGALHAGLSGVYAYPGTPSTEITEFIQGDALARERGVRSRWCTNEKTAMEAALGMSYAGKRALVCMKHVGMNVCADAFVNAGITGVKGGLVVVAADDPSMHSSQNEQDSRFYGKFALIPNAKRQYAALVAKQPELLQRSLDSSHNLLEEKGSSLGVIACGIAYNYVREALPNEVSVLKVSQYPLPEGLVRELAAASGEILVVEDGQPFAEEQVRGLLGPDYPVSGRLNGRLPRTGELNPDNVAVALGEPAGAVHAPAHSLAPRPPQLCQGCGHRDVYTALNQVLADYPTARVFGDIGCYTLGALPPFRAIDTCVDMGASITMAKGAADAGVHPAVAVIGDSTFTHSGMTSLLDAVNDNAAITVILSDNLTTAMTGGQDSAGTHKFEAICLALGVEREHLHVVVPLPKNMEEITRIIREELDYKGVSVIIPQRECMQTLARKNRQKKAAQ